MLYDTDGYHKAVERLEVLESAMSCLNELRDEVKVLCKTKKGSDYHSEKLKDLEEILEFEITTLYADVRKAEDDAGLNTLRGLADGE